MIKYTPEKQSCLFKRKVFTFFLPFISSQLYIKHYLSQIGEVINMLMLLNHFCQIDFSTNIKENMMVYIYHGHSPESAKDFTVFPLAVCANTSLLYVCPAFIGTMRIGSLTQERGLSLISLCDITNGRLGSPTNKISYNNKRK